MIPFLAIPTGLAVGGFSQDPLDHPIAGLIGAGIGATTAYNMVYHKRITPISSTGYSISYNRSGISSELMNQRLTTGVRDRIDMRVGALDRSFKNFDRRKNKVIMLQYKWKHAFEDPSTPPSILEGYKNDVKKGFDLVNKTSGIYNERLNRQALAVNNINTILTHRGIVTTNPITNYGDIKNLLANTQSLDTFRAVNDGLSLNTRMTAIEAAPGPSARDAWVTKISNKDAYGDRVNQLAAHFRNSLGHNNEDALQKARGIATGMAGHDYSVIDGMLSVTVGGKNIEMPLTGHTQGATRFSKVGNTFYASKRVNPFLGLLSKDPSDLYDKDIEHIFGTRNLDSLAAKELDPEELLSMFRKTYSDDGVAFEKFNEYIRSMKEYSQAETHLGSMSMSSLTGMTDDNFSLHTKMVSAHSVDFMKTLREKDKAYVLGDVETIGQVSGGTPYQAEMARIYETLHYKFKENPLAGQGVNTIGRYTSRINGNLAIPNAIFPTAERGNDAQLLRPYIGDNTYAASRFDVDKEVGRWISKTYGGHLSLDDGAGLISDKFIDRVEESQYQKFSIHQSASGRYIVAEDLANIIKETDPVEKKKLMEELIPSDFVFGFDKNGSAIKVGNVYTGAKVHNVEIKNGKIDITLKSTFSGKTQNWLKLYGVSSKAGYTRVDSGTIKKIQAVQQSIRFGVANVSSDGVLSWNAAGATKELKESLAKVGNHNYTADDFVKHTQNMLDDIQSPPHMAAMDNLFAKDAELILGASEGGNDILSDMLNPSRMVAAKDKLAKQVRASGADVTDPIFAHHLGILEGKETGYINNAKAALFMLAQTDYKGNADITHTLGSLIDRKGLGDKYHTMLNSLKGGERFFSDRSGALADLNKILDATITHKSSMMNLTTHVATDLGEGLHGIGNVGSMSWLERDQLLASGYTQSMIDKITTPNQDALFELKAIQSMEENGAVLPKGAKTKHAAELANIFDKDMESRTNTLKGIYGTVGDFVSYGLDLPEGYGGAIRSVPIPLVDTNRSGLFEQDTDTLLKSLDKSRKEVVQMDIMYSRSNDLQRRAMSESYTKALQKMESIHAQLMKGEGNIIKSASKRTMEGSSFMTARSIGGNFAEFMEGRDMPGVAINEETGRILGKRSGQEMEWRDLDKGIKQAFVKGTDLPYTVLMSREPAQGAFSVLAAHVFQDTNSRLETNHAGIANLSNHNDSMYHKGMMGDFDYDAIKVASMNFADPDERLRLENINAAYRSGFNEAKEMIAQLTPKGKNREKAMLGSFGDFNSFMSHQMFSGYKGKQRKFLAAHSTDMAMNMTEALQRHLKSLGLADEEMARRSIMGRTVIHNMTEAMLKSAHRSSNELKESGSVSAIEHMRAAYKDLAGGKTSAFDEKMRASMSALFATDFVPGGDAEARYNATQSDIINGAISHAQEIEREGGRIQDFRGARSMSEIFDNLSDFASSGRVPAEKDTGKAARMRAMGRSSRGFTSHIKRNILANKKPLFFGGLALAATAMTLGAEKPEMTKESLPYQTSDGILPPLQSENAHVYKKSAFNKTANVRGQYRHDGAKKSSMERTAFGPKGEGRTNITIRDKRERSY